MVIDQDAPVPHLEARLRGGLRQVAAGDPQGVALGGERDYLAADERRVIHRAVTHGEVAGVGEVGEQEVFRYDRASYRRGIAGCADPEQQRRLRAARVVGEPPGGADQPGLAGRVPGHRGVREGRARAGEHATRRVGPDEVARRVGEPEAAAGGRCDACRLAAG